MGRVIRLIAGTLVLAALVPAAVMAEVEDRFTTSITPDGGVLIAHYNAYYNCCYFQILYDVSVEGNTLYIVETEDLGDMGCFCLCYFDLEVTINDLAAGTWTIDFTWEDRIGVWLTEESEVVVPESGQGAAPVVADFFSSACHDGSVIQTREISMAALKILYR